MTPEEARSSLTKDQISGNVFCYTNSYYMPSSFSFWWSATNLSF